MGDSGQAFEGTPIRNRDDIRIRDPYVVPDADSGYYYVIASTTWEGAGLDGHRGVGAFRTRDLETWEGPVPIYAVADDQWGKEAVWAPEVHAYKGRFYLFTTLTAKEPLPTPAGRPPNVRRGTQVFHSDTLLGPYRRFANKPHTPADWMALDGTLWVEDGVPYMVFCHEWMQVDNGTMEIVQLADDLSGVVGQPRTLFKATDASWALMHERLTGLPVSGAVTDGPFFFRLSGGGLAMIWSSFREAYTMGVCYARSGSVQGPWEQFEEPLFIDDGGHGMIFRTFDGQPICTFHQPNTDVERAQFYALIDRGDRIALGERIDGLE